MTPHRPNARVTSELRFAGRLWPEQLGRHQKQVLKSLCEQLDLRLSTGDISLLDGRWYITHAGLLRLAEQRHCTGIRVQVIREYCNSNLNRWVFKATVYKTRHCKGYVGYGDADPSNVSPLVRGAEMRIAETRAVNRALRKAYGIGICSVEEIGTIPVSTPTEKFPPQRANGGSNGTGPRVRDRLCQIIRQHKLDPELVKAYAVDFCGTETLREASRERVQDFVQQLAERAQSDRNGLLSQLNRYALPKQEGAA